MPTVPKPPAAVHRERGPAPTFALEDAAAAAELATWPRSRGAEQFSAARSIARIVNLMSDNALGELYS